MSQDDTNFSYLHLSGAGEVRRPPIDVAPADTGDLASALVRCSTTLVARWGLRRQIDQHRVSGQGTTRPAEEGAIDRFRLLRSKPRLHATPSYSASRMTLMTAMPALLTISSCPRQP